MQQSCYQIHHEKPWSAGDTYRADNGTTIPLQAGLFIYSGLAWGHYYSTNGLCYYVRPDPARERAKEEGVTFLWRDGLTG